MKNDALLNRAILLGHPYRIDYKVGECGQWGMWCYFASRGGIDHFINIWERLQRRYPEWTFRLVIGGGL